MKTTLKTILLMAALTIAWGCSSNDDNDSNSNVSFNSSEQPDWTVDYKWTDAKPSWQAPDPLLYENRMFVIYKLDSTYISTSTNDDVMAVFINGECRGISSRNVVSGNDIYFSIMVCGNADNVKNSSTEIKYYNAGLKNTFTCEGPSFISDKIFGGDQDQIYPIGADNSKYKMCNAKISFTGNLPFSITDDDLLGVFVNGECRGTGKAGETFLMNMTQDTEQVQIRYYSAAKKGIYTVQKEISVNVDADNNLSIEL